MWQSPKLMVPTGKSSATVEDLQRVEKIQFLISNIDDVDRRLESADE